MTDARPRDWRAIAKLAADMQRHGPVRPASAVSAGDARLAGEAEAQASTARAAEAATTREAARAAAAKAEADRLAAEKASAAAVPAVSGWYATGETRAAGRTWDMASGKPIARTASRYVRLAAALTDAEAATAKAGGAGLQALVRKYGIAAQEWTTGVPT